ncbi:MAG: DHH family phosphoesterase [Eubacteriales bacterium]
MSDFTPLTLTQLCRRLLAAERPVLVMHTRPDGDTVGSAAALAHMLALLGKRPRCLCADEIPSRLSFLLEGVDLAPPEAGEDVLVVAVDVAAPVQLGSLAARLQGRLAPALMIDHHQTNTPFADHYLRPEAAACGEVVYEILLFLQAESGTAALPRPALDAVYAALMADTGCFKYANVTPHTLRTAADLLEQGADAPRIGRLLFDTKPRELLRAEALTATKLASAHGGRISYAVLTAAELAAAALPADALETAIDVVRSLEGTELAFVLRQTDPRTYRVSLRSVRANVAAVAARFGGGGHHLAAGCNVQADSPEQALEAVLAAAADALLLSDHTPITD